MLKSITESPYLNLLSGLVLLITSIYEIVVTAHENHIGISHGVFVFSVIQVIKAFPEIMRGLTEIEEAGELAKK